MQRLTEVTNTLDHYPVWSPDGNRIAFISSRSALSVALPIYVYVMAPDDIEMYMMNADGTAVRLMAFTIREMDVPIWRDKCRSLWRLPGV